MEETRDDLTRIHVESIDDWHRTKERFKTTMMTSLDDAISSSDAAYVREPVAAHLLQVQLIIDGRVLKLTQAWFE